MAPPDTTNQSIARVSSVPDEILLKIAKEIVVKFIEVGRITPTSFETNFKNIYATLDETVRNKNS
jgi:hypothetical protein